MDEQLIGIGIIRCSTEEQIRSDRGGIDRQRTDIQNAIRRYNIKCIRIDEFQESGSSITGSVAYKKLINDDFGVINCLVVSSIDRLFRPDDFDAMSFLQRIRENNILIITPNEIIDMNKPGGYLQGGITSIFSGFELMMIRLRMLAGKEELRKRGFHVGGKKQLPWGVDYEVRTENGTKKPHFFYKPDYISKIKLMYDMIEDGKPYQEISEILGLPRTDVSIIARNKIFCGFREYHEKRAGNRIKTKNGYYKKKTLRDEPLIVKVIENPIITPERHERICKIIETRRKTRSMTRKTAEDFIYSGIAKCADCENALYVKKHLKAGMQIIKSGRSKGRILRKNHDYYICSSWTHAYRNRKKAQGREIHKCHAGWQQKERLEMLFTKFIAEETANPDFIESLIIEEDESTFSNWKRDTETEITYEIEKLEKQKKHIYEDYVTGSITKDRFNECLDVIENKKKEAKSRLQQLGKTEKQEIDFDKEEFFEKLKIALAEFEILEPGQKRKVAKDFFNGIYCRDYQIESFTVNENRLQKKYALNGSLPNSVGSQVDRISKTSKVIRFTLKEPFRIG